MWLSSRGSISVYSLHDMRRKENSCHSDSLLFSSRNAHISRFLRLISASCCHGTAERENISTNACNTGADRRSRASGPVSLYVVIRCNQNLIQFSVSKFAIVSSVAVQLALHCFLVIGTGQCTCTAWCCCGIAASNLYAMKLNFLVRLALHVVA